MHYNTRVHRPPVFSGVRVTRSLVLRVCSVNRCLSFCTFSFGHFIVCPSSIYGFWLPLWYLQTLLSFIHVKAMTENWVIYDCIRQSEQFFSYTIEHWTNNFDKMLYIFHIRPPCWTQWNNSLQNRDYTLIRIN